MISRVIPLLLLGNVCWCAAPASAPAPVEVPQSMRTGAFTIPRTLMVPPGFRVSLVARLTIPRFLAMAPNGDIFVSQPTEGKISVIRRSVGADVQIFEYASGLRLPHDIVFHAVGATNYVYIAESHQINRFRYNPGDTLAQGREIVVTDLPDRSTPELGSAYGHPFKNIAFDRNHKLYVSIASACNVCASDTTSDPVRGAIYQYNADGTGRRLFARGIRNAEGLAMLPGTSQLWVVVNGRDEIAYPHQDSSGNYGKVVQSYVDNHPPEPFTSVRDGGNYGWPFCNPTPDSATGLDDMPFDRDVQTNAGGAVNCAAMDRITRGIQAHSAPLGLSFLHDSSFPAEYRNGAVVALHGSWNRSQPTGYKIAYFPWNSGAQRPAAPTDLVTGWLDATATVWGRPVDVIPDGDGLLISDDVAGAVYRLFPANGPGACSFTLNPRSTWVGAEGGTVKFQVTPNTFACPWSAASSASWAQVFPLTGQDTSDLEVTVYPNYSIRIRTALIEVGGQMFRIDQFPTLGTSEQRFVGQIYFNFFGRNPSTPEVVGHINSLVAGLPRRQLVYNFLNSEEFNQGGRFVAGLYVGLLDRDAEYDGWLFQRNALATAKATPAGLILNFLNSAEYSLKFGSPDKAEFVRLLYRNVLGREADPAEVPVHVAALSGGTSRADLAAGFLRSEEFRRGTDPQLTAFLLYSTILLRGPSLTEQSATEARIRAGVDLREIIGEMLAGNEFASLLN